MKILLVVVLSSLLVFATSDTKSYVATAYCLKGKTASGGKPRRGIVATGNHVSLGSKVKIEAGPYSGTYLVCDRGVTGNHVDIWVPTRKEATEFGRRTVKLTVLK